MPPFKIENIAEQIRAQLETRGIELVELRFGRSGQRSILMVTADKPQGITLEECAELNRYLSQWLDEAESQSSDGQSLIPGSYLLEVSSPGLDRLIKTEKDFARILNEEVRLVTKDDSGHVRESFGKVTAVREGVVTLTRADGVTLNVALDRIAKAQRQIRFGR